MCLPDRGCRAGPGLNFAVVGGAYYGDRFPVIGRAQGTNRVWYQVALPGGVSLKALETRPKLIARDQQREAVRMYVDPQDIRVLTE